jgi:hypothetical protein
MKADLRYLIKGVWSLKMQTVCDPARDSTKDELDAIEIENRIRHEFWTAFADWDDAPDYQKAEAASRLNQCVRQLYDFVVRGKVPQRMAVVRTVLRGR